MSDLEERNPEERTHGFKWGTQKGLGGKKREIMFYKSFSFQGQEYFLFDCVYFNIGQPEASVGKLVKMFEGSNHVKRVKVIWFMRPSEIRNFLGNYEPRWNEIFLASGKGRWVSNINLLEAIIGKCNVVCTSNDPRNPQASEADLRGADYFFCRHFDVGECVILDVFPDLVDGVAVDQFFNKKTEQKPPGLNLRLNVNEQKEMPVSFKSKEKNAIVNVAEDDNFGSKVNPMVKESKTVPVGTSKQLHLPTENALSKLKTSVPNGGTRHGESSHYQVQDKVDEAAEFPADSLIRTAEVQPFKKRKLHLDEMESGKFDNLDCQRGQDRGINIDNRVVQVSSGSVDRKNWFKQLPWEQRLERAQEAGTLVSLENLDVSFSSKEVEDLLWHAFKEKVEAKMIEKTTFSCPHYGKALIIFNTKEAAVSAISQLMRRCLMLADGRPVIATKGTFRKPVKVAGFVGHLTIDRVQRQRQNQEKMKAKATSHAAQPKNIEHEMGMQWRILQEKADIWWKALHERQAKEIQNVRNQLKMKTSS